MAAWWFNCMSNGCLVVGLYAQWLSGGWIVCPMAVWWLDFMPNSCLVVGLYAQWLSGG